MLNNLPHSASFLVPSSVISPQQCIQKNRRSVATIPSSNRKDKVLKNVIMNAGGVDSNDVVLDNATEIEVDEEAYKEAEAILKQLEKNSEAKDLEGNILKYMPSNDPSDPIVQALTSVLKSGHIIEFSLIDSRWNGNEVFKYTTQTEIGSKKKDYFVKLNRVEDASVFLTEAISLSALAKTESIKVPLPLHIGKLPKVGDIGPGAFMILEYLPLAPFGIMQSDNQAQFGEKLAALHSNNVHQDLHQNRFGFSVSNYLALTPLDNSWEKDWTVFFGRRFFSQIEALCKDKQYAKRAIQNEDDELITLGKKLAEEGHITRIINTYSNPIYYVENEGNEITPSLLHGDLWIGNSGATKEEGPVLFDPASFFGHSEMELAMMTLFGGFRSEFWDAYFAKRPKVVGFEFRHKLYQLYYYLNQLNLFGDGGVYKTCLKLATELLEESTKFGEFERKQEGKVSENEEDFESYIKQQSSSNSASINTPEVGKINYDQFNNYQT